GLAEFTNDGKFIRRLDVPKDAPYMYDVAVKPERNRMVTSSFTPLRNYRKPLAQMDLKDLGDALLLWDFRARQVLQTLTTGAARKLCTTGKLPADLRQSPDDRFLYVSCFVSNEIQQWDVSNLMKPRLASTIVPGVQPNMMHVTGDGKRMYITNSLLSTLDHAGTFWVRLAHIGPDGMKMDPFFNVDLNHLPTGPARGHDMLLYSE